MRTAKEALREIRNRLVYLYGKIDGTFYPPTLKEVCEIADEGLTDKGASGCNAAEMRDALMEIVITTTKAGATMGYDVACGIIKSKAKHALSKPPRNCDRFNSVKEAAIAFARECQDAPQPCPDFTFSAWLFAPAAEWKGESDGK